jgi:hypothetical protein
MSEFDILLMVALVVCLNIGAWIMEVWLCE